MKARAAPDVAPARSPRRAMSKRPNFLFIITDQQRADHLGAYGNAIVRTPNIDALARGGFRAEPGGLVLSVD